MTTIIAIIAGVAVIPTIIIYVRLIVWMKWPEVENHD
jgi:hypothetical protein